MYIGQKTPKTAHKYPFIGDGISRYEILESLENMLKNQK